MICPISDPRRSGVSRHCAGLAVARMASEEVIEMYKDDDRILPYDGAAEIPNEIQKIRDPIIFGMTKRELLFVSLGLLVSALSLWILFKGIGLREPALVLIPVALGSPFGLFAFIRPMGLDLEDWLTIWMSNNVKSAPIRKLSYENEYEKAIRLALTHREKARKGRARDRKGWMGWTGHGTGQRAGRTKKGDPTYKIRM